MTERMLTQYALKNQKDMLAADRGDEAAAGRVAARREAMGMALIAGSGGLVLTAGSLVLAGAAPELVLAARLAVEGCRASPVLCLNQAGIFAADIAAPEAAMGTGALMAGGTLIVGKTAESAKQLAQKLAETADTTFKNKAFNVQPVEQFIRGEAAAGAPLSAKTADYLRDIQKANNDQLIKVFDRQQADTQLNVFGKQFEQVTGLGGSNKSGSTKIFATEKMTDREIFSYAQSLAGGKPLAEVRRGQVWTAVLDEKTGMKINLRNVSKSVDKTGARWTIDIIDNKSITKAIGKNVDSVEIKFR